MQLLHLFRKRRWCKALCNCHSLAIEEDGMSLRTPSFEGELSYVVHFKIKAGAITLICVPGQDLEVGQVEPLNNRHHVQRLLLLSPVVCEHVSAVPATSREKRLRVIDAGICVGELEEALPWNMVVLAVLHHNIENTLAVLYSGGDDLNT